MKNLKIKTKLIILFILIKVIPLLLLSYIAIEGARALNNYFEKSTHTTFERSKEIIEKTGKTAVSDSINALDKKSQEALERLSYELADKIAAFLYERDNDLLFLSKLDLNNKVLQEFYNTKVGKIAVQPEYIYNDKTQKWEPKYKNTPRKIAQKADLKDNAKEFNQNQDKNIKYKKIPLYKEIEVIDLKGKEIYKVSSINKNKLDISKKQNTYCKAETYFKELKNLKKGEIYVSDVIGAYVKTKVIGAFTKAKAQKAGIKFEPEKYGYAGVENPVGKRFEGIIRFATPIYKNGKKVAYVAFALDYRHIMEFSDTFATIIKDTKQNISNAGTGNYAFLWDYKGRNISHPRDYFIMGFNPKTGERVPGWVSADVAQKFKKSGEKDLNKFLKTYPKFEKQSLKKKPNLAQLKLGELGLDCRYLNFAPQCEGWMQLTKDGGYGSFVIFWSKVWKLTTAAAIPYYTGKYKNSKRGFGFVSIGANVDEFHLAANKTKQNVDTILKKQVENMRTQLDENKFNVVGYIKQLINELSFITIVMIIIIIVIAIMMSNFVTGKIQNLLDGTKEFSKHNFEHKIKITSTDEIGELEKSFNTMAEEIKGLITKQEKSNILLELKVKEADAASKAKSDFLAAMSHEIRTPLNALSGFIEILIDKETDQKKLEYLKIIKVSGQNLLNVINDILDFSKIESNKVELEYIKINPFEKFIETSKQFEIAAKSKNIDFEVSIAENLPKCIQVDIFKVTQVINNLISNAIKFTGKNGKVEFNIQYNGEKDEVIISIKDTGIGISQDKLKTIFDPFSQADNSTTRKYGGTGLGLTISSRLVELMGGKLQVQSDPNNGAKFYFNIPLKKCDSCIVPDIPKTIWSKLDEKISLINNKNSKVKDTKDNIKILVVEDNTANQMFMKVFLKKLSLDYKIVNNGKEAVDIYKNEDFSIIFMDENMPVMSGIEATRQIREYEKTSNKYTPIIALTANALRGDEERFIGAGMDDYLTKPLKKELFRDILKKYLEVDIV